MGGDVAVGKGTTVAGYGGLGLSGTLKLTGALGAEEFPGKLHPRPQRSPLIPV